MCLASQGLTSWSWSTNSVFQAQEPCSYHFHILYIYSATYWGRRQQGPEGWDQKGPLRWKVPKEERARANPRGTQTREAGWGTLRLLDGDGRGCFEWDKDKGMKSTEGWDPKGKFQSVWVIWRLCCSGQRNPRLRDFLLSNWLVAKGHFLIDLFIFLILSSVISQYILKIKPFLVISFANHFLPHSLDCLQRERLCFCGSKRRLQEKQQQQSMAFLGVG